MKFTAAFSFILLFSLAACTADRQVVEVTRPVLQTVEVTRIVTQTGALPADLNPTATPMPLTTLDPTTLAPDFAAELKIFPLYPGTRWVYTEVNYTQTGDPNQIISAVTSIEDQVADTQNVPPYYIAHIHGGYRWKIV